MAFKLGQHQVGGTHPVYFIADLAANHDGEIDRALQLIHLAKEAGADAAKFQNFKAEKIVSDTGFRRMDGQVSHQAAWGKSVFEVYQDASVPDDWTPILKAECDKIGIEYMTTPYDLAAVDTVNPYVNAFKVGSGDIDWIEHLIYMADKQKPILVSTGASTIEDVQRAMDALLQHTSDIVLMQCNTNYTNSLENFKYINLNVLKTYATLYPETILGLSDHTPGHATVLGAVALGAKVIEKHFTDDNARVGPDHAFSMNPMSWRDMVDRTRELEAALGSTTKKIEDNEKETAIIQRRSLRLSQNIKQGDTITRDMLAVLRPVGPSAFKPCDLNQVIGKRAARDLVCDADIAVTDVV